MTIEEAQAAIPDGLTLSVPDGAEPDWEITGQSPGDGVVKGGTTVTVEAESTGGLPTG